MHIGLADNLGTGLPSGLFEPAVRAIHRNKMLNTSVSGCLVTNKRLKLKAFSGINIV